MKRFRFPLHPVAVLRADREMKAKEVFAHAVRALSRAEGELAVVRAGLLRFEAALRAGRSELFSPTDEVQAIAAYRRECENEANVERSMHAARAMMQQRRAEYLAARRNVEVVAKLEEKARAAHRMAHQREEQAALDDFAGRSAGRRATISV